MKHSHWRTVLALMLALLLGTVCSIPAFAVQPDGKVRMEAVSFRVTSSKSQNMKIIGDYIDKAAANDVDLILFPELSTCGLPDNISMTSYSEEDQKYFDANAEYIPEGPTVQSLIAKAKQYNMYICWSMMEKDHTYPNHIYNTAVLVGPEGFIGSYRKVNLAGTEAAHEQAGTDGSEVFDTPIGKIGLVICFDKVSPETVRDLKLKGAEIVLAPSSWPGLDQRLGNLDPVMELYRYSGSSRNVENGVVLVETNWAAAPDDTKNAECGHARITDAAGKVYGETGWTEGTVVADVDVKGSIAQYYDNLRISEDQHKKYLQDEQDRQNERNHTTETIEDNIRFYGSAILNTLGDLGDSVLFRAVLKK